MKKYLTFFSVALMISVSAQNNIDENERNSEFYDATDKWFSAWELVSKRIYTIDKVKPVDFIFFDDKYVYSTSDVTIKNGEIIRGSRLMNLRFRWKKALHYDTITLPDKSRAPVNLMSFASDNNGKPFFIMPLPSFWKRAGIDSKELGFTNLVTGVFVHEFSHSQQMNNFGKRIDEFERQNDFGTEFNDDIVQEIFEGDSAYLNFYRKEVDFFYAAIANGKLDRGISKKGFATMEQRQQKYFTGKFEGLKLIDDFFLTMEGFGQYSMYLWLTHPEGGRIEKQLAINGVRRGRKWWSQDEGFALFLLLDQLTLPKTWAQQILGEKTDTVLDLLDDSDTGRLK